MIAATNSLDRIRSTKKARFCSFQTHGNCKVMSHDSNISIRFCMEALLLFEQFSFVIVFLLELPENLGAVISYKKKVQQRWL